MKLHEMAAANFGHRDWYHGTTKHRWNQILEQGYMAPSRSDDESFGEAVWFTSDYEEASEYGDIVVIINNQDVRRFRNKKISSVPHGLGKQHGSSDCYHLVILDEIPKKFLTVSN